ncbi:hypothetical protein NQ176_g7746 [Zarea fungicola]|uniref:Uncharacterized protein n=1 Tax=Zarea fungicola TaxID=93591 RepID=A0ACC1MYU4_9HYPO|nr:hypothetical protein NQ176_g7746 [Lecanicillium fungicola]
MYQLKYRVQGHSPSLVAACRVRPTNARRVARFTTTHSRCAGRPAKKLSKIAKSAEQETLKQNDAAPAGEETKGRSAWTTLREKLQQATNKPRQSSSADSKTSTPKTAQRGNSAKSKQPKDPVNFDIIIPRKLKLKPIETPRPEIPKLSYGLDRVLFNEGVYRMQDNRTLVYNFDPYLASIMPVEEFDYDALKEYVTSSKDTKLRDLAKEHGKKYSGSTSSMTAILSHFHYLISGWRLPNFSHLSRSWEPESNNFTILTRGPAATFLKYDDGVYSIDSDKQYDNENILSMLGKSMEKLLTLPKEDFEKYKKTRSHQLTDEEKNAEEAYHFTTFGDFMMRSQLDAHDPRLPGSGVFDLKTRAVVSIRMDVQGHEKGVGYEIRKQFGEWESFEREYYDLIRSAFLKYSLQVRMGRMDGIFVAYHNTQRIFGFQYIPLSEMDHAIHGQQDTRLGDEEFKASLAIMNDLLERATKKYPKRSLRLHVETRPTNDPVTYFFVEPVSDEQMRSIQESNKKSVEQLREEINDLSRKEEAAETAAVAAAAADEEPKPEETEVADEEDVDQDAQNEVAWQEVMGRVSEAVESESLGIRSVRDAVQDALTHSGLLEGKTEAESEKHIAELVSALTAHSEEQRNLQTASEETVESQNGDASTPLRDLILRVTKGIDENTANLNEFQRMFAGLSEKSIYEDKREGEDKSEERAAQTTGDATEDKPNGERRELLGMYVTIRNKVDGKFVPRPEPLAHHSKWEVQYAVGELSDERAQRIYKQIKTRRKKILDTDADIRAESWHRMFAGSLPTLSKRGETYRAARTKQEESAGIRVAWERDYQSTSGASS